MKKKFKSLDIHLQGNGHKGETQFYVTESSVTKQQVLGGDDTGVICLCFTKARADTIALLLNNHHAAGGDV